MNNSFLQEIQLFLKGKYEGKKLIVTSKTKYICTKKGVYGMLTVGGEYVIKTVTVLLAENIPDDDNRFTDDTRSYIDIEIEGMADILVYEFDQTIQVA